jgi:uncharacterized protein
VHVRGLWRYPVKSMQGEACVELELTDLGVAGDRSFGVLDVASQTIVSAKRDGRLLQASARFSDRQLLVNVPQSGELAAGHALDDSLSEWLGRQVKLVAASGYGTPTFEGPDDYEQEDLGLHRWDGQRGSFVDESPLHLVSTSDLAELARERPELQWDARRFRPNVLVEAPAGDLTAPAKGRRILVGGVELEVLKGCTRCVMTTRAQPGGIERQLDILRHVITAHANVVGFRASVAREGTVRVGDPVRVATSPPQPARE